MTEEVINDAVVESTDEKVALEQATNTEDVVAIKSRLEQVEKSKSDLEARAKKAEAELKQLRTAQSPQNFNHNSLSSEDVDVKILESQGVDQESIDYLKKLAKLNSTSVLAAQQDPIYKTYKANKEADERAEKASLGASKGSGQGSTKKTFNTPGLSDDEHKRMWLESQGR